MKRRPFLTGLTAAILLAGGGYVVAVLTPPNPRVATLERAAGVHQHLSFHGTIASTSMVSSKPFEMRLDIKHQAPSDTKIRTNPLWRPPDRWCGHATHKGQQKKSSPGQHRCMILPWWRENARTFIQPIINPHLAARNYSLQEIPGRPIDGRKTRALKLTPFAKRRPSYLLLLDRDTDATLGLEVTDPACGTISAWHYETFAPGEAPEQEPSPIEFLQVSPESSQNVTLEELRKDPPFDLWMPRRLPDGFSFHTARVKRWRGHDKVTLSYTDGIAVFSITESSGEPPWKGRMSTSGEGGHGKQKGRRGAGRAHAERPVSCTSGTAPSNRCGRPVAQRWTKHGTTLLNTRLNKTQIHIMGMLPPEELTDVLKSMAPHPQKEITDKK